MSSTLRDDPGFARGPSITVGRGLVVEIAPNVVDATPQLFCRHQTLSILWSWICDCLRLILWIQMMSSTINSHQIVALVFVVGLCVCCVLCVCVAGCGAVVLWCCGAVVLWCCGAVVLRCCGVAVLWCCGAVVVLLCIAEFCCVLLCFAVFCCVFCCALDFFWAERN